MNRYLFKYFKISLESIHCIDLDGVGLNESGGVVSGVKLQSVLYTDR